MPELHGRGEGGAAPGGPPRRALAWLWVALWLAVVLRFSQGDFSASFSLWYLQPFIRILELTPQQAAAAHFLLRKGAHVVEYAVLGFLSFRAAGLSLPPLRAAGASLLFCLVVAGLDEAHQATLETRTGSPFDVALDASGALLGVAIRRRTAGAARGTGAKYPP